jgi:hypothetical protein
MKRFTEKMTALPKTAHQKFFRDNFIAMMGQGLDPALHDAPTLQAA